MNICRKPICQKSKSLMIRATAEWFPWLIAMNVIANENLIAIILNSLPFLRLICEIYISYQINNNKLINDKVLSEIQNDVV